MQRQQVGPPAVPAACLLCHHSPLGAASPPAAAGGSRQPSTKPARQPRLRAVRPPAAATCCLPATLVARTARRGASRARQVDDLCSVVESARPCNNKLILLRGVRPLAKPATQPKLRAPQLSQPPAGLQRLMPAACRGSPSCAEAGRPMFRGRANWPRVQRPPRGCRPQTGHSRGISRGISEA